MRLHAFTLDEREAMRLRAAGWKFKRMDGAEWEMTYPDVAKDWPKDPRSGSHE
jgi:hypothetical protein